jgi:hypothetical protein
MLTLVREHFFRSRKGNLYCRRGDLCLTVFARRDGSYAWCIADGDDPSYSPDTYADEDEALDALLAAVEEVSAHGSRVATVQRGAEAQAHDHLGKIG